LLPFVLYILRIKVSTKFTTDFLNFTFIFQIFIKTDYIIYAQQFYKRQSADYK